FSSRRRHTRSKRDWSSDVCSSDLPPRTAVTQRWDMWRYAKVMPLADGEQPVSLGEGLTPMHDAPQLAKELGVRRLWIKDEGLNRSEERRVGKEWVVRRAAEQGKTK